MALVQPRIEWSSAIMTLIAPDMLPLDIALGGGSGVGGDGAADDVSVCGARRAAQFLGTGDEWFSAFLGRPVRLARRRGAGGGGGDGDDDDAWQNFQNTSALLLVNEASVRELNARLAAAAAEQIDHRPFRANVVVDAAPAFGEDGWRAVRVGAPVASPFTLLVSGRCNRCQMINVAPDSGVMSDEPLRTLALYRRVRGQIAFGVHLQPAAGSVDRVQQRTLQEGQKLTIFC